MLRKTTLAVLGLAVSSVATAGTMGPVCTPGNVTVPCEARLWDLGVQALYLRSAFDADKAYAQNFLGEYHQVNNEWDWGYKLEGSFHFNTGNDVTLNWLHYRGDVNQVGVNGIALVPQLILGNLVAVPTNTPYTFRNEDRLDQVNLVMGQHADFGLVKKMRFYGGLQYAKIQVNDTNYYPVTAAIVQMNGESFFDNTDFSGVGPVVGIDYSYNLTNTFSVTANGAGSILYGTSRYNAGYVIAPSGGILTSVYGSKKAVVPSLEAKLGVNYGYQMAQGILNIEGGYQVVNYFNPLQTQRQQNISRALTNSDYGLYGPYLGLKYVGNA